MIIFPQPMSLVNSLTEREGAEEWPLEHGLRAHNLCNPKQVTEFPHLHNGTTDRLYLMELWWGLNKLIHMKLLDRCLAHSGGSDVHCC